MPSPQTRAQLFNFKQSNFTRDNVDDDDDDDIVKNTYIVWDDLSPLRPLALLAGIEASLPPSTDCLSWYSWKHGTMQRLVWHSGQWYFVLRRKILPCASIVFQQKLQPRAGPGLKVGQWLDLGCDSNDKSLRVDACDDFFKTIIKR